MSQPPNLPMPSGEWNQPTSPMPSAGWQPASQAPVHQDNTLGDPYAPTIWEGKSEDLVSTAVGGRGAARYRLAPMYLYWETGYLTSNAQQIPLISIGDVDVRQSLTQKPRRVGDVVISAGRYSTTLASVREPHRVRDVLMQTVHQAAANHRIATNTSTHFVAQIAPQVPPMPAAPPAPPRPVSEADQIFAQLRQLGELRDAGIVTEEEFQTKKAEMLGRL